MASPPFANSSPPSLPPATELGTPISGILVLSFQQNNLRPCQRDPDPSTACELRNFRIDSSMQPATLRTPLSRFICLLAVLCLCGSAVASATLPASKAAESMWQTVESPGVDASPEIALPLRSTLVPDAPASSRLSIGIPAYDYIPASSLAQSLPQRQPAHHYDLLRPLSVSARGPPAECDYDVDPVCCVAPKKLGKWEVGEHNHLRKNAETDLDSHHVGQDKAMRKFIPDYDRGTAPAMLVPKQGHTVRNPLRPNEKVVARKTTGFGSARDVVARDIRELRRVYPDIPREKLTELIEMNKFKYKDAMRRNR